MYPFLSGLLSDKKGGEVFMLFGPWHIFYMALTMAAIVALLLLQRGESEAWRMKTQRRLIAAAFALYVTDFFLMPLAYGEIDIEKLPFHACTAMCVVCFLSYRVGFLAKYRISFVLLGFISNLVYLIYPAGVMWHAVHPLSYRVIQTLIFHALMTVYGAVTLASECYEIKLKGCGRDLAALTCMTAWALLGNYTYNGTSEGYSHFFNWFFVVRDPFYLLPASIAPYVMPFLNLALFFGVEVLIRLAIWSAARRSRKKI